MPPFDTPVLFRGVTSWNDKVYFWKDKLTRNEEGLDFGGSCLLLDHDSDFVVITEKENPTEYTDQWVTHWCRIPEELLIR